MHRIRSHSKFTISACLLILLFLTLPALAQSQAMPRVTQSLDISPVWSGHRVGFALLTHGDHQYAAFYNQDRQMTVASRTLDSNQWQTQTLDSRVAWDSHNYIAMTIDAQGFIHVSGNMHCVPLVYFRTAKPFDISTFKRIPKMTGELEDRCTYPRFFSGAKGELIFTYRDGGSGNGNQIYNVYDLETQSWRRLLDSPLTNGQGLMNAYLVGPELGPDHYFHMCWVWRDTPDCATNHDLSYARSKDLVHWETAAGAPITLPMTLETKGLIVDHVQPKGGIINGNTRIGFDSQNRPIISYHKFDDAGITQLYNARLEQGQWKIYQTSDWTYRWYFEGGGTIPFEIHVSPVVLRADGMFTQAYSHNKHGSGQWKLDEATLKPIGQVQVMPQWPRSLSRPESKFTGMEVRWQSDAGTSGEPDAKYFLRWETLGPNRDRPRDNIPEPTKLRLYKIQQPSSSPKGLAFMPAEDEAYRFDTGTLQGTLRSGGKSRGLSSLTHVSSGIRLDGGGAGIFSHYRVFTTDHRYGQAAWDWPSQSKCLADGAVQVLWPAGDDHPFELTVVYRWRTPNTLDVETTVKAHQTLPQFESFLACYFSKNFPASSVYAKHDSSTGTVAGFATTEQTFGDWQMFPRDRSAVRLIQDGRWAKEPNPVAWAIRPDMALPIGIRRHAESGLTAIVMAPPEDCFAISTPYVGEGHFSLYLSLFGRTVAAGETATAHSRLVVADAPTDAEILALYLSYMQDLSGQHKNAATTSCSNWPFYALCMDTHDAQQRTLAQQAALLRELGYAGCAHLWLNDVETRVKTLTEAGLGLFQVYLQIDLSKSQPLDEPRLTQLLPLLKAHHTQLALLMTGGKPSDRALDDRAVDTVKRLADLARPYGVTIVLYPHTNDWLETCGDAVRIAAQINRPGEVGVMFNLCHWMKADANRDLRAVLKEAGPWLTAVSLSGSDTPDQVRAGSGQWIQPLDQGSYDIKDFLRLLQEIGYASPVGLQCYGIEGDARIHLERSMAAWRLCDSVSSGPDTAAK